MTQSSVTLSWCRDADGARKAAKLFGDNLTASYISHGELQGSRAVAPGVWVPDIAKVLENEILGRIANPDDAAPGTSTMLAAVATTADGSTVGVVLLTFSRAAAVPYCVLEDIVVRSDRRDQGYGQACLDWVVAQCRARSISRIFLESGVDNNRAHDLFKHNGFETVSVVMMKEIGTESSSNG